MIIAFIIFIIEKIVYKYRSPWNYFLIILLQIYFIKYLIASSYLTCNWNSIIFISQILLCDCYRDLYHEYYYVIITVTVIIEYVTELLNKYDYL